MRVAWMHEDNYGEPWIPHIYVADADSVELIFKGRLRMSFSP